MKQRRRLVFAVTWLTAAAGAVFLGQAGARAEEATAEAEISKPASERLRLYGFGGNLTFWEVSGVTGGADSYENQIAFVFEPSWKLGKLVAKGTFWEKFNIGARLILSRELAGNDAAYRGNQYASPALFSGAPESIAVSQAGLAASTPGNQIDGTSRNWGLTDMWLNFNHPQVYVIPKIKVDVTANLRMILPTSLLSRNVGFMTALSPSIGVKKEWKGLSAAYAFRATKYFYKSSVQNLHTIDDPVLVNGRMETPYQPTTSGVLNPEWGIMNAFVLGYTFPGKLKKLSIEATYLIINTWTYPNSGGCTVPGVPLANPCTDGQAVGDVIPPGGRGERDSSWFLAEIAYQITPFFGTALGLSTYQPLRSNGLGLYNPIFNATPTLNVTTAYLALTFNVEKFYARVAR